MLYLRRKQKIAIKMPVNYSVQYFYLLILLLVLIQSIIRDSGLSQTFVAKGMTTGQGSRERRKKDRTTKRTENRLVPGEK